MTLLRARCRWELIRYSLSLRAFRLGFDTERFVESIFNWFFAWFQENETIKNSIKWLFTCQSDDERWIDGPGWRAVAMCCARKTLEEMLEIRDENDVPTSALESIPGTWCVSCNTTRHVVGGKLFNESRYNTLMDIFPSASEFARLRHTRAARRWFISQRSLLISQPWIISNKTWLRSIKGESFETWKSIFPLPHSSPFGVFQALVKVAQFSRKYRSLS